MLTPEQLDRFPDSMVELYAQLESDILADMARRISTYDYFIPSAEWQFRKQKELRNLNSDIIKQLSRMTGKSESELKKLMSNAGAEALTTDDEIYKAAGLNPPPINQDKALLAVLSADYLRTNKLFKNLSKTTAQTATGQFESALDRAHLQIMSGAFDRSTAVRQAVKDLSKQGVGAIKYPSGHIDTLEVAVRRATVTGVNQTCLHLQGTRAEEMGCDLVETTAHGGARPEHAVWQGKIFSRSGKHPKYPDFYKSTGYGTGEGLGGWNCRHGYYPFFEGISTPAYSKSDLTDYEARNYTYNGMKMTEYEASQKQRYIERQQRRWKRENMAMQSAGLDTSESAAKIARWKAIEKDFCKQTGLKMQADRSAVGGFGKSEARKAYASADKTYKNWSKSIGANKSIKTLAKYYDMKYNNSPGYKLLQGYVKAIEKADISPLIGFGQYQQTARQIKKELVGLKSVNGVEIKGYVTHFIDRVIGQVAESHPNKRTGVPVGDVKDALLHGKVDEVKMNKGKPSQRIITDKCVVTINPETGFLIQTNPRKGK